MARVNKRINHIAELNRKQRELKTVAGKIKDRKEKQELINTAAPITAKLEPKKTRSRIVKPEPEVKEKTVETPQQAYDRFCQDMINHNCQVIELQIYKVIGPRGQLAVYFKDGRWEVGTDLRSAPIAGSTDKYRALAWAQKRLMGAAIA